MKNMKSLGKLIKRRLEELNMTQSELAEKIGVNRSAVSRWISGQTKPDFDTLLRVAKELQIDPMKLLDALGLVRKPKPGTIKVRVLSADLPCGTPRQYIDTYVEETIEIPTDTITTNPNLQYYAVRAKGNSMILRGIADGYLVIFSPDLEVRHGDVGVVWVNNDGVCARIVLYRGDHIILQAANPAYEPIILDRNKDEYRIIGRVVAVRGDPNKISSGDIYG